MVKYYQAYQDKLIRNIGEDNTATTDKMLDAFNDAMSILYRASEFPSLKTTLSLDVYESQYVYAFDEWNISDLRKVYSAKIYDGTRYWPPMSFVTPAVWDERVSVYLHSSTGRPTIYTHYDDNFYISPVPNDNSYTLELRFYFQPAMVTSVLSEVDLTDIDDGLEALATALTWLKLEEVELYREWVQLATIVLKGSNIDLRSLINFEGGSRTSATRGFAGAEYWKNPFVRSTR